MKVECPAFCDLQVNGFAGVDFNRPGVSPEDLDRAAAAQRTTGVTRFLPTLITSSLDDFAACARAIARWRHPACAGIHMEGPYISTTRARGAHPAHHIVPASRDDFERRQEAAEGRIVLVTLAPEVPGALALLEHLVARGVRAAIGHSDATPEQVQDAVRAGATLATHLGNGCAASLPRHPNLLWEQLAADALTACFIADGYHLTPATLKAMVRAKTPARTILVTDATPAAGAPPGRYGLGGQEIDADAAGRVTLPGTTTLAGSALTLDRAIGRAVRDTGLALEDVLPMVSTRPAAYLGLEPAGRLRGDWDPEAASFSVLAVEGA
jgi:N-acetylglucosamine-6-phosphate deacetylase